MTDRLPRINAADVIRALERAGFVLVRQSGSHKIYKNAAGKRTTVPFHSGKELHPRIFKSILRDTDMSVEEFLVFMK